VPEEVMVIIFSKSYSVLSSWNPRVVTFYSTIKQYVPSITTFFISIPLCRLLKACVTHNASILTMISQGKSRKNRKVSFIQWKKKCHHTETLNVLSLTTK
jgi:hypothetical protein